MTLGLGIKHWSCGPCQVYIHNNTGLALTNFTSRPNLIHNAFTRDVFYVRREVDVMKTAKANAYIIHIFGKIELLSIHAT